MINFLSSFSLGFSLVTVGMSNRIRRMKKGSWRSGHKDSPTSVDPATMTSIKDGSLDFFRRIQETTRSRVLPSRKQYGVWFEGKFRQLQGWCLKCKSIG